MYGHDILGFFFLLFADFFYQVGYFPEDVVEKDSLEERYIPLFIQHAQLTVFFVVSEVF